MRYLAIILLFTVTSASAQIYHRDPCPPSGGLTYTVDSFTSNGTWTKPAGTDFVILYIVGGGSGGRGGRRGAAGTNRGGGGGLSSTANLFSVPASLLSSTESVVIGTGGAGGTSATTNNANGGFGGSGGTSYFKSSTFASVSGGPTSVGGSTTVTTSSSGSITVTSDSVFFIVNYSAATTSMGTNGPADSQRPFSGTNFRSWRGSGTVGGSINSSNTQFNSGTLPGFYINDGSLLGEQSGVGEGVNGGAVDEGFSIGQYINRFFPFIDPADISGELPRGGMSGGPGDTAGTIAGGNGASGRGYGAAGGGGGASTNGANSGAGAKGNDGVVIVISVDYE